MTLRPEDVPRARVEHLVQRVQVATLSTWHPTNHPTICIQIKTGWEVESIREAADAYREAGWHVAVWHYRNKSSGRTHQHIWFCVSSSEEKPQPKLPPDVDRGSTPEQIA